MATINPSFERNGDHSVVFFTFETLTNGDDGAPIEWHEWADRSIQVLGTFGSGGTIVWEGSNDGTNYVTLTDPQGNALSFTSASLEQVSEITRFARPRVTAGDGTTDLDVHVVCRRPNNMRT